MNSDTATLQQLDAAHHLHPFTNTADLNAEGARIMVSGKGVHLTDSDGKRYLDAMAGLWCVNIGYGREEIAEAAAAQMRQLPYYNTFFGTTHPPAVNLAATLARLSPEGFERVFFTSSGSEAVDTAYRIARHYWNIAGQPDRKLLITRDRAYHGSTIAGAALTYYPAMAEQGGDILAGSIRRIAAPYTYPQGSQADPGQIGLDAARALEKVIDEEGSERVAAFIGEPVMGAGGVIIPPESYWPEVQRICAERDILLIADEVICGFGRTGQWFGSQTLDIKPDMMTFAKGVSSGYLPVGGVLVNDRVGDAIAGGGGDFIHGHTYSGHPACCAAALENLRLMEEESIVERCRNEVIPAFAKCWQQLGDHPLVGESRSLGLLAAIELTPDKDSRAPFPGEPGKVGLLCRGACFRNGLIMRSVYDTMVVSPPLTISESEINELVERAVTALNETQAALKQS